MVDEALRREAQEQALHHSLFQMQLHYFIGHHAGIFKDHGTNGRVATPVPYSLIALAGNAQRVHGLNPGWIGTLVERREATAHWPLTIGNYFERFCAQDLKR